MKRKHTFSSLLTATLFISFAIESAHGAALSTQQASEFAQLQSEAASLSNVSKELANDRSQGQQMIAQLQVKAQQDDTVFESEQPSEPSRFSSL